MNHTELTKTFNSFMNNWVSNAQDWLDAGHSREQVAIWLMQHLGPKVAKEVLKSV